MSWGNIRYVDNGIKSNISPEDEKKILAAFMVLSTGMMGGAGPVAKGIFALFMGMMKKVIKKHNRKDLLEVMNQ